MGRFAQRGEADYPAELARQPIARENGAGDSHGIIVIGQFMVTRAGGHPDGGEALASVQTVNKTSSSAGSARSVAHGGERHQLRK